MAEKLTVSLNDIVFKATVGLIGLLLAVVAYTSIALHETALERVTTLEKNQERITSNQSAIARNQESLLHLTFEVKRIGEEQRNRTKAVYRIESLDKDLENIKQQLNDIKRDTRGIRKDVQ